jgi:hypothetical protein
MNKKESEDKRALRVLPGDILGQIRVRISRQNDHSSLIHDD